MSSVTIVMYHYVRDTEQTPFPGIHALGVSDFERQLDYLTQHYSIITPGQLIERVCTDRALPENSAFLTFDDGYVDHIETVAPRLAARGIKAAFFPAGMPSCEGRVLGVNKIQFVRAKLGDARLIESTLCLFERYKREYDLKELDVYRQLWVQRGRLDTDEMRLIKNLLQKGLPKEARDRIIDDLFAAQVSDNEKAFAASLYATPDQLQALMRAGHHVGNHGYGHEWLDELTSREAAADIARAQAFLSDIGAPEEGWMMCYPYGGCSDGVRSLARTAGAAIGLGVDFELAHLDRHDGMALPRLDANQIPPLGAMVRH